MPLTVRRCASTLTIMLMTRFSLFPQTWRRARVRAGWGIVACAVWLSGCAGTPKPASTRHEAFGAAETYSRLIDATPAQTCEAGRRALLSQGYIVNSSSPELVEGTKHFQPDVESHLKMLIRVVCVPEDPQGQVSLAFVTGVQESYSLKKANTSASLGLSAIGSLSIPLMSSSDSMVKVGVETISEESFYDGFFSLLQQYLNEKP